MQFSSGISTRASTRPGSNGHKDKVRIVSYSADGKTLALASWDNTIKLWDVATTKDTATLNSKTHFDVSLIVLSAHLLSIFREFLSDGKVIGKCPPIGREFAGFSVARVTTG